MPDWHAVRRRLAALQSSTADIFGAGAHRFELLPPLTDAQVAEAEAQWAIAFPADYRSFLLHAGAGGAGPYYGVFPLVNDAGKWCWRGDGGDMTAAPHKEWVHAGRWNLDGHPIWTEEPFEEDERFETESYDDAVHEWNERFDKLYWDERWTEGGICLCHEGCALRDWLVVTGPQRGQMWWDGTADRTGLMVRKNPDGSAMTFGDWYLAWLDKCERAHRGETVNW